MSNAGRDVAHWSQFAAEWIRWARTPNHDAFWAYRDGLSDYLGQGPGDALDVGCGEGRVSRLLKARGYRVTAVDPVAELVEAAKDVRSADAYAIGSAGALPFGDKSFDLVVAYNMLMDVEDVSAALQEFRRVLRREGTLFVSVVHPLADFLLPGPSEAGAQASYFQRRRFEAVEESRGLRMHFAGWTLPLQAYASALEEAGFVIASLREPAADFGDGRSHMRRWSELPLFLWLKARIVPG